MGEALLSVVAGGLGDLADLMESGDLDCWCFSPAADDSSAESPPPSVLSPGASDGIRLLLDPNEWWTWNP